MAFNIAIKKKTQLTNKQTNKTLAECIKHLQKYMYIEKECLGLSTPPSRMKATLAQPTLEVSTSG